MTNSFVTQFNHCALFEKEGINLAAQNGKMYKIALLLFRNVGK
jgi:hypothetical protein